MIKSISFSTILNSRPISGEITNIDTSDYPDFCDAFVTDCYYQDSDEDLSESEMEELQEMLDMNYLIHSRLW